MARNRFVAAVACLLMAAASLAALSQDAPKTPDFVVVYQDHVKPSMVDAYTAAAKDMVALLKEEKADDPAFNFWAFSATDFTFSYVTPMDSFGALDAMHKAWMGLYKGADKAKWEALDSRMSGTLSCSKRLIAVRVPEASYTPKQSRLTLEEAKYRWFDIFDVVPGQEKEFVQHCKALADLSAKAGFPDMWMVYAIVVGDQMPCYVVISPAKDQADYMASEKAWEKAIGDEGKKEMAAIMAITGRYDGHSEWYRPDLSHQGPSAQKAAAEKGATK